MRAPLELFFVHLIPEILYLVRRLELLLLYAYDYFQGFPRDRFWPRDHITRD